MKRSNLADWLSLPGCCGIELLACDGFAEQVAATAAKEVWTTVTPDWGLEPLLAKQVRCTA